MGILKLVPPAYVRCPGSVFGCIPPMYWTVGIGTVWKCDHCGRVWERVSRPGVAWAKVTKRETRHEDWCHTVAGCTEPNHCTCENGSRDV